MKVFTFIVILILLVPDVSGQQPRERKFHGYVQSRPPLRQNPFIELPLGAIKPKGWLNEMLVRQRDGSTGMLDSLYPTVLGKRNGWLGGDGDQWERGPYWIDGLVPLAYILNDKKLIAKARPWIEWAITSQQPDGYFGPSKDYPGERGIQRNNSRDWWPKMVMLKVLKQYYEATNDQRVIQLMTKYFRYQLNELPKNPLDRWTFWARFRGGDNLMVVYWLYNITGENFLLNLAQIIHQQTFDYTSAFLESDLLSRNASIHCVNLAQGFKEPLVFYQQYDDPKYLAAVERGLADLKKFNGMAHGLFGGDEALHGNNPTQGSELCSAVEMMFSLETMLSITGQVSFADQLEKIAFNALPTQTTDDYSARQYFQQANQVMITRQTRNFDQNHGGTDLCYGLLTGYPCCTTNMHQGWPKFVQNLWYATPDHGLAALVYSPSEVSAFVADGIQVTFREETNYPFDEKIRFTLSTTSRQKIISFPFYLRVPSWCKNGSISINGNVYHEGITDTVVKITREWKNNDVIELHLPMHVFRENWYENSVSIERGPLVYALKIAEDWKLVENSKDAVEYGNRYFEVYPKSTWNYGLIHVPEDRFDSEYIVEKKAGISNYPWNPENAPIKIIAAAKQIPSWQLYNGMTGPIPFSIINGLETGKEVERVTLIPYGCTNLRIAQFPVIRGNR